MIRKLLLTLFFYSLSLVRAYSQEKIILLNEGNWQADNGRVSYFEDGAIVSNQWFRDKNGYKLGDTPNDIIQINDNLIAMAINWSNIVQFIRPDGTAVAATEDVPNNRKLASDGKYVYISSYGHECGAYGTAEYRQFTRGYVAKIDVSTFKIVDAVEVGYEPEGIAYYKGYLFVANTGGYAFQEDHEYETTVSVIDASTMQVVRTVDTGQINLYGKMSQSGQYLCINSPGNYYEIEACSVIFDCEATLNGAPDNQCCVTMPFAATYNTTALDGRFYAIGSRYSYYTANYTFNYVTIDPVKAMESEGGEGVEEELPGTVLEDIKAMSMPYGIYVNPYTGYIYATDAGSYVEAGLLYQWDPKGNLLGKHKVYINPAHFLALPPDGHFTGITDIAKGAAVNGSRNAPTSGTYNLAGQRVTDNYRGIVVRGGKKYLK